MSIFSNTLKGVRPALEADSLIAQAAKVVESQASTDPVVINQNAEFEAEIERLKAKTAAEAGSDPANGDPADAGNGDGGGTDPTEPTNTDPAEGTGDPANGDNPEGTPNTDNAEEKPVDEDSVDKAAQDALADETEGGDLQAAADKSSVDETKAAAVESFHMVLDQYKRILNVHETGKIGSVHIGLCSATMKRAAHGQGIEVPALALESGDGVLARIAEYIRELIAKVKAAFASLFNWVREFFRGYKAATGKYDATRQGVQDRMDYLKGKGVVVTDAMLTGKKVKVPGLANVYGNSTKEVLDASSDLLRFSQFVTESLNKEPTVAAMRTNLVMVTKFAQVDANSRSSEMPGIPLSAEQLFGKVGNLSKLGSSAFVRDNVAFSSDAGSSLVKVQNLVGGYTYAWTLEAHDTMIDVLTRAERLRAIDFRQTRAVKDDFEVEALTPAKIEIVTSLADQLIKIAESLVDTVGNTAKMAEVLKNDASKAMEQITASAKNNIITEKESFILASLAAMSPDVYSRITINPVAKLTAHLHATADSLMNWCVLSSKAIEEAIKTN